LPEALRKILLIREQQPAHLPELPLVARALSRLCRRQGIRVHLLQRKVPECVPELSSRDEFLIDQPERLLRILLAERALETAELNENDRLKGENA